MPFFLVGFHLFYGNFSQTDLIFGIVVQGHVRNVRKNHEKMRSYFLGEALSRKVLVDNSFDSGKKAFLAGNHGNPPASGSYYHGASFHKLSNDRNFHNMLGIGRRNHSPPSSAGVLDPMLPFFLYTPLSFFFGKERSHGFGGVFESGIVRIHLYLGYHAYRLMPFETFFGHNVSKALAKHIPDESLGFGTANIHGHGRHLPAAKLGVTKINIDTDGRLVWTRVHREFFRDKPEEFDFRPPGKVFMEEYNKFIVSRNELLGSAGQLAAVRAVVKK